MIGPASTVVLEASPQPVETPSEPEGTYPGVAIDQVFPILHGISSLAEKNGPHDLEYDLGGFRFRVKDYVPLTLQKEGRGLFRFPRRDSGGYWATVAGVSHLRGPDTKEIYVAVSGPGGVCCTNYSIVDTSSPRPRTIHHSENFGRFRGPMEIFDAENDGIYELVQFDSCLRYFQDDCGSCSPEPRVSFKYRNDLGKYWPVKNVTQDFVREGFERSDKWISEKYAEWKSTNDPGLRLDLHRSIIAHAADLIHIGEAEHAWNLFSRFPGPVDRDDQRQLLREVQKCGVYKSLYAN